MIMGFLTRLLFKVIKKDQALRDAKPMLGGVANVGLLYVMFLIMSLGSTQVLADHPIAALKVIVPLAIYYAVMLAVILPLTRKMFVREHGFPVFFSTFLRYHVISLGIALAAFTEKGDEVHGVWVLLPIMAALLIQPLFTSILAKSHLETMTFADSKGSDDDVATEATV
jgi:ACR3 family arsenite efflux pump ArsB